MRFAFEPTGQSRQVRRDKRHGLSGEAAKRTLTAAMAEGVMLNRRLVVVDLDAELGSVAKKGLELGGDRRIIGASEGWRGESRPGCDGEQLSYERKSNGKRRQLRPERRQAALCPSLPKREYLASQAHQSILR
jgi:hypothetical protein